MHATKVGHRLTQTIGIAWVISHKGLVQWAGYNYFLMLRFMWFLRAGNHVTSQHFAPFCAWRVSDTGTGLLAARPSLGPKRAFQIDQTWSNHWPFQVPQLGQVDSVCLVSFRWWLHQWRRTAAPLEPGPWMGSVPYSICANYIQYLH